MNIGIHAHSHRLPWLHPQRVALLEQALRERILVIDGAMGTMIQRHELQEADYRGERFAQGYDHAHHATHDGHGPHCGHDLKGNNDLLLLSKPEIIAGIHRACPGCTPTASPCWNRRCANASWSSTAPWAR